MSSRIRLQAALLAGALATAGSAFAVGACSDSAASDAPRSAETDAEALLDAGGEDAADAARSDGAASATVRWTYRRDVAASGFVFDVEVAAEPAHELELTVEHGTLANVVRTRGKTVARVTASRVDGAVRLLAADPRGNAVSERTVLALAKLDARWNVPELVPGLVNTGGTEDSAELSPDGQWLIVGTYSPVDIVCCLAGIAGCTGASGTSAAEACNVSRGPYEAPARPMMLGRDRILSQTKILHAAPRLGLIAADGGSLPFAVPPVAAYGFRRQPDGTFAEPFVIGLEMNGASVAPFGFSFLGPPSADLRARVLFAWNRADDAPDTGNDVYVGELQLGQPNILGAYTFDGGLTLDGFNSERIAVASVAENQGNPAAGSGRLFWDTEGSPPQVVRASSWDGGAPTAEATIALSGGSAHDYQPFVDGARVYFARDFQRIVSAELNGEPSEAGAWGALREDVALAGPANGPGIVASIGEPSVAHAAGVETMVFVAYVKTETGFDGSVVRVDARP